MARPAKPVNVIQMEKKSHRTKKELAVRQKSEQEMLSGERIDKFTEVKNNTKASREFDRVVKIFDSIEKNDKMYETVINRYCLMLAECRELEDLKKTISVNIKHMIKLFKENIVAEAEPEAKALLYIDFAREIAQLSNTLIKYDREIEKKRGMLLAIEKESGMTMAAMLRTIPKKQEQGTNPLLEVLCSE